MDVCSSESKSYPNHCASDVSGAWIAAATFKRSKAIFRFLVNRNGMEWYLNEHDKIIKISLQSFWEKRKENDRLYNYEKLKRETETPNRNCNREIFSNVSSFWLESFVFWPFSCFNLLSQRLWLVFWRKVKVEVGIYCVLLPTNYLLKITNLLVK